MAVQPKTTEELSRDDAHARAREALTDAFFWDASDPTAPFGGDVGLEVIEALRDARDEDPQGDLVALLDELLTCWEVASERWDVVDEAEVQAIGEEDELGLLLRDEALLALAFGQIVVEGRVDAEIRRRALLALRRQSLPALLYGFGDRARQRAERVERMREVLSRKWD